MNRRLFFWLERLKITPTERKAVTLLMGILLAVSLANLMIAPASPFGGDDYKELEEQFAQRTADLQAQEAQLMQQYFPPIELPVSAQDTIPADSVSVSVSVEEPGSLESRFININTAGKEALVTLPGIGPVYAQRIIDYRESYGAFQQVEELINIRGIGEKRLDKLKPFIKLTDSD